MSRTCPRAGPRNALPAIGRHPASAEKGERQLKRRVVITGMGAVTPLGNSVAETWEGICAGKSGIARITKFDCAAFDTKIAGELKGFDPLKYVNRKELRRVDDFIVYALAASEMALADAGLVIGGDEAERTGVIIGSAIGGLATIEREKEAIFLGGPRKMSPFTIPAALANLAAGHVSIRFGAKGPIGCPVAACASGTCAIGDASRIIAGGYADVMIAGGVEAAVTPLCVAGFNAMRAISKRNDEPEKASRPFDRDRDGFVIGEGCGLVILESLAHALETGRADPRRTRRLRQHQRRLSHGRPAGRPRGRRTVHAGRPAGCGDGCRPISTTSTPTGPPPP